MTADFVLRVLHETSKSDQHAAQQMLALLQTIVPYWPASVSVFFYFIFTYITLLILFTMSLEILYFMSNFTSTS